MKTIIALALALAAAPALAANPYAGSGQRAGGPAYQLNSETGFDARGAVDRSGGYSAFRRDPAGARPAIEGQARSGQHAGGPGAGYR